MGRYIQANCRLCRSQKQKLMLKGNRCLSFKCPIDKKDSMKRKGLPGRTSNARIKKSSNYSLQLKEKQKIRQIYGLLERQFKRYFDLASRKKGITGENLLILLETRLDNVVYQLHFASSRKQARQIVKHGHIEVNGTKVDIPSFNVKEKDVISVKEKSKKMIEILESLKRVSTDGVIPWLEVNSDEVKGIVKQLPRRSDIKHVSDINEQVVVELYSK